MPRSMRSKTGTCPGCSWKNFAERLLVGFRNGCRIGILRGNSEHISRIDGDLREHDFFRHPVVAFRVSGRDVPFIAPEKISAIPREDCACIGGQQVEEILGSRSAGERNREAAPLRHRFGGSTHHLFCRYFEQFLRCGQDSNFDVRTHADSSVLAFAPYCRAARRAQQTCFFVRDDLHRNFLQQRP